MVEGIASEGKTTKMNNSIRNNTRKNNKQKEQ